MEIGKISGNTINNTIDSSKSQAADSSFEDSLKNAMNTKDQKQLKKACDDFEGIMMSMMYKEMKATIQKSDLLPSDTGNDIFDSMLDDQLMNEASKGHGIGLSDVLYKQLSKQLDSVVNTQDKGAAGSATKK